MSYKYNKMYRNIIFSWIPVILSFLPAITKGAELTKKDKFGIEMLSRATDIICFQEQFIAVLDQKPIPLERNLMWHCFGKTKQLLDRLVSETDSQENNMMNIFQEEYKRHLQDFFRLSPEYSKNCNGKLKNQDDQHEPLFSKALKDEDKPYPMKSFTYCLLLVLQKKYGEKVFETYELTIGNQLDWRKSVLAHLNRIRSRHGSPIVEMDATLEKNAQTVAIKYAVSCIRQPSTKESLRRGNQSVYEITACASYENPIALSLYNLNYWYADGLVNFDFKNMDKAKRFYGDAVYMAQLIWKKTNKIGLGFAYSKDCFDKGERAAMLVLQFFPGEETGNAKAMKENMKPPKN